MDNRLDCYIGMTSPGLPRLDRNGSNTRRGLYVKRKSGGFTLIELMIVVAIIGILASLAVSAWETYTVRAQVSEGLSMAAGAKTPIADAWMQSGIAPADRVAAGLTPSPSDTSGGYVSGVNVVGGRVDVTFGGPDAHAAISGQTLSLTPYVNPSETAIVWRCGYASAPDGTVLDATNGPYQSGSITARYVPSICRP